MIFNMSYDSSGLYGVWVRKIKNTLEKIIDEDERISKFLDDSKSTERPVKFNLRKSTTANILQTRMLKEHPGHITRKYVNDTLAKAYWDERDTPFTIGTTYCLKDGRVYIREFCLIVRIPTITRSICEHIFDLEHLWMKHEWLLRHEIGHCIDHIINVNGISLEEYNKLDNEYRDELDKYHEWLREYRKQKGFNPDTANRAYYNISGEARANEYAGIDVEEMIQLTNHFRTTYGNKTISVDISITDIKDKEKSKKEND